MKLNIDDSDTKRCFRVGKPSTGKCRPLLVKLFNGYHPSVVFQNKKMLQGFKIVIREYLMAEQSKLLKIEKMEKLGRSLVLYSLNLQTIIISSRDLARIYYVSVNSCS